MAIVDFLYFGETNINQENLDSFLNIAEELKLQGLTEGIKDNETQSEIKIPQPKAFNKTLNLKYPKQVAADGFKSEQSSDYYKTKKETTEVRTVAVSNISFSGELQDLDDHIKSLMFLGQNMTPDGKKKSTVSVSVFRVNIVKTY